MTLEEFQALSFHDREVFLESGGTISTRDASKKEGSDVSINRCDECVVDSSLVGNLQQGPSVESLSEAKEAVRTVDVSTTEGSPAVYSLPDDQIGFDFDDPIELLLVFDDEISSGRTKLHDWQIQFMLDFANTNHTKESPFLAEVRACNGSGKDMYVVAACCVWVCMKYRSARAVATNGSGVQLDNQTELHINNLCTRINRKLGATVWKCNYRYYECLVTDSPIVLFATDEPLKAEGFHPIIPGGRMSIFASEAKSIPDEIFTALARCNGATHRVNVSSPGSHMGFFYNKCSTAIDRKQIKDIKKIGETQHIQYHITAYDCPHITKSEIQSMANDMPGGENGDAFKSAVLAEFGSGTEMVVISYTYVWKATRYAEIEISDKWIIEEHNKAGLDLADGGAETILFVRNGNRALKQIPFKFDNSEDTVKFLEEKFEENSLTHKDAYIFGDCVGIGKPILDRLKKKGWSNIRYVDSRRASTRPKTYKNYNAQMWFEFAKLLQQKELILIPDQQLITQLSNRYYKIIDGCVHQLLTKVEMRSRGFVSPDRADACVLSFTDYKSTYVSPLDKKEVEIKGEEEEGKKVTGDFVLKSWAENQYGRYRGKYTVNGGQKDWSEIQEQITENNKQLKLAQKL